MTIEFTPNTFEDVYSLQKNTHRLPDLVGGDSSYETQFATSVDAKARAINILTDNRETFESRDYTSINTSRESQCIGMPGVFFSVTIQGRTGTMRSTGR